MVALGLLALGAAGLAFLFPTSEDIRGGVSGNVKVKIAEPVDPASLSEVIDQWAKPPDWPAPATNHHLVSSDGFIVLPDARVIKITDVDQPITAGGMTIRFIQKYELPLKDGNVDFLDPDGDGFYNLLEFQNQPPTNPKDPASHPPLLSRLRLEGVTPIPFKIKFTSKSDFEGVDVYFFNVTDDTGRIRTVRVQRNEPPEGQKAKLNGYILGEYREDKGIRYDKKIDAEREYDDSTLDLLQPEIDRKVTLKIREPVDSPDSTVEFVMLLPGAMDQLIKVRRGEIFALPQDPSVKYRVVDTTENAAKIRKLDDKEKIDMTIPKVTQEEKDKVPQPPAPSTAPTDVPLN